MEFCPRCGKVLTPSRKEREVMLVCRKCGYTQALEGLQEVIVKSPNRRQKTEVVVIEENEEKVLPKTDDVICPNCGHNEAYWWTVQTRSADEPMTQFFRCVKCSHTWREYA
ncbi:MAG TPA: transcription factor S [Candidatus Caldiarchaeum subterraneum]|uniref:Transcription factor S n=1 Tax=Caldiarchaeum subterraneum TaxID=311458 RepID=A0A832ZV35_CALS0|nr:transcription factor S [Candidatus Caldarchaeum subterraneum]